MRVGCPYLLCCRNHSCSLCFCIRILKLGIINILKMEAKCTLLHISGKKAFTRFQWNPPLKKGSELSSRCSLEVGFRLEDLRNLTLISKEIP